MFKIKSLSLVALLCLVVSAFSFLKGMESEIIKVEISLVKDHRPFYQDLNSAKNLLEIFTFDNNGKKIKQNELLVKCKPNVTPYYTIFPLSLFINPKTGRLIEEGENFSIPKVNSTLLSHKNKNLVLSVPGAVLTCKNGTVPFQEELLNCIKLCKNKPEWCGSDDNKKKLLEKEILTEDKHGNVRHGKNGFDFDKIEKMRGKSKYFFAALFGIPVVLVGALFLMFRYPDFFSFKNFK